MPLWLEKDLMSRTRGSWRDSKVTLTGKEAMGVLTVADPGHRGSENPWAKRNLISFLNMVEGQGNSSWAQARQVTQRGELFSEAQERHWSQEQRPICMLQRQWSSLSLILSVPSSSPQAEASSSRVWWCGKVGSLPRELDTRESRALWIGCSQSCPIQCTHQVSVQQEVTIFQPHRGAH